MIVPWERECWCLWTGWYLHRAPTRPAPAIAATSEARTLDRWERRAYKFPPRVVATAPSDTIPQARARLRGGASYMVRMRDRLAHLAHDFAVVGLAEDPGA